MNKALAVSALLCCALGATAQPARTDRAAVANGQSAYMRVGCFTCHGTVGQGGERGAGPRIAPNPWPWPAFAEQTRRPRAVMVPYSEKVLPEQDLADIYAYVVSIKPGPAAKDIPLLRGF